MLDPRLLRNELDTVVQKLARRGFVLDAEALTQLEQQRKEIQVETETLQNERNTRSRSIGKAKAAGEDIEPLLAEVANLGDQLKASQEKLNTIQDAMQDILMGIPNIPHESVPDGKNEEDNVEIRRWGELPEFEFEPKDHVDLGNRDSNMDFETAAKLSGARFVVLRGALARMHRALIQYMLDIHTSEHGYQEHYVPYLVNADSLRGTGQLPKFEEDLFATASDPSYYLIPTAEVPVTNMARGEIIEADRLPVKLPASGPSRSFPGKSARTFRPASIRMGPAASSRTPSSRPTTRSSPWAPWTAT